MREHVVILVEHGPGGVPARFAAPQALVVAHARAEVLPALERLEAARRDGAFIAGWIGYEAGLALEDRLSRLPERRDAGALLAFGIFDAPLPVGDLLEPSGPALVSPPVPKITREDHARAMERLLAWIAAGDCYQVNLTVPLSSRLISGSPRDLFALLRGQGSGHGSFVDLSALAPDLPILVSLSPELFFRSDAQGHIEARPMKGTRPRDRDPARDHALAKDLRSSEKDRAENLMIVDLLRNDIARIARPGSVKVPALFALETYPTVHQMTSTVTGRLAAPASLPGLMQALFPCGSITGAPKIRAMEIIDALEPFARGPYCGAIGWMGPDGAADFSVAIRTLAIRGQEITLNAGGGIVHQSTADGEWEEALWKTRFLQPALIPG